MLNDLVYYQLISQILREGVLNENRTGVSTLSIFGAKLEFDLTEGFPLLTHKKLPFKSILAELLWFLEGSTDERRLAELTYRKPREELIGKTTIWTENANAQGVALGYTNTDLVKELGPIYGSQWRNFDGSDQILNLINDLKTNPQSRRHILSAWNVSEISRMALPPCHVLSQFDLSNGRLNALLYQRSADVILGSPFNIASYALLLELLAREIGVKAGKLVYMIGNAHIYSNHIDAAKELIARKPFNEPTLVLMDTVYDLVNRGDGSYETSFMKYLKAREFPLTAVDHFASLLDYEHHPAIKLPMAV